MEVDASASASGPDVDLNELVAMSLSFDPLKGLLQHILDRLRDNSARLDSTPGAPGSSVPMPSATDSSSPSGSTAGQGGQDGNDAAARAAAMEDRLKALERHTGLDGSSGANGADGASGAGESGDSPDLGDVLRRLSSLEGQVKGLADTVNGLDGANGASTGNSGSDGGAGADAAASEDLAGRLAQLEGKVRDVDAKANQAQQAAAQARQQANRAGQQAQRAADAADKAAEAAGVEGGVSASLPPPASQDEECKDEEEEDGAAAGSALAPVGGGASSADVERLDGAVSGLGGDVGRLTADVDGLRKAIDELRAGGASTGAGGSGLGSGDDGALAGRVGKLEDEVAGLKRRSDAQDQRMDILDDQLQSGSGGGSGAGDSGIGAGISGAISSLRRDLDENKASTAQARQDADAANAAAARAGDQAAEALALANRLADLLGELRQDKGGSIDLSKLREQVRDLGAVVSKQAGRDAASGDDYGSFRELRDKHGTPTRSRPNSSHGSGILSRPASSGGGGSRPASRQQRTLAAANVAPGGVPGEAGVDGADGVEVLRIEAGSDGAAGSPSAVGAAVDPEVLDSLRRRLAALEANGSKADRALEVAEAARQLSEAAEKAAKAAVANARPPRRSGPGAGQARPSSRGGPLARAASPAGDSDIASWRSALGDRLGRMEDDHSRLIDDLRALEGRVAKVSRSANTAAQAAAAAGGAKAADDSSGAAGGSGSGSGAGSSSPSVPTHVVEDVAGAVAALTWIVQRSLATQATMAGVPPNTTAQILGTDGLQALTATPAGHAGPPLPTPEQVAGAVRAAVPVAGQDPGEAAAGGEQAAAALGQLRQVLERTAGLADDVAGAGRHKADLQQLAELDGHLGNAHARVEELRRDLAASRKETEAQISAAVSLGLGGGGGGDGAGGHPGSLGGLSGADGADGSGADGSSGGRGQRGLNGADGEGISAEEVERLWTAINDKVSAEELRGLARSEDVRGRASARDVARLETVVRRILQELGPKKGLETDQAFFAGKPLRDFRCLSCGSTLPEGLQQGNTKPVVHSYMPSNPTPVKARMLHGRSGSPPRQGAPAQASLVVADPGSDTFLTRDVRDGSTVLPNGQVLSRGSRGRSRAAPGTRSTQSQTRQSRPLTSPAGPTGRDHLTDGEAPQPASGSMLPPVPGATPPPTESKGGN